MSDNYLEVYKEKNAKHGHWLVRGFEKARNDSISRNK